MDRPAIHAAEEFVMPGYPLDAEALLIVELDGPQAEVDHLIDARQSRSPTRNKSPILAASRNRKKSAWSSGPGARPPSRRSGASRPIISAWTAPSRARSCRKSCTAWRNLSRRYGLRVANVFHAGDGNLHPLILFDANDPDELERAEKFGADILRLCVKVGGVLTGEHGVGIEKRDLMPEMFSETDLNQQQRLKCAFDDQGLLNPGKVFPVLHRCAELGRMHVHGGKLPHPDLPRF